MPLSQRLCHCMICVDWQNPSTPTALRPACPALCSMPSGGLEHPHVLTQRPLLLLLWLLLRLVTRAQTAPDAPVTLTRLDTTSTPSLGERARALMRNFPLVDGCVGAGGGLAWPWAGEEVQSMQS